MGESLDSGLLDWLREPGVECLGKAMCYQNDSVFVFLFLSQYSVGKYISNE